MICLPTENGRFRSGLTLAEILVVLVIIVGMFVAVISVVNVLGQGQLRGASSRLATTIEYIYGRAAINGVRYQLVIDLDENTYWAECSEEMITLSPGIMGGTVGEDDSSERPARYDDDDDEADPFGMNLTASWDDCTDELVPSRSVRDGVVIDSVMTTHQSEPYVEGTATIGFFPNGFVEPSVIWLREEDNEDAGMTLFVEPMTGSVRIETGLAEVPDDFLEVEEDR